MPIRMVEDDPGKKSSTKSSSRQTNHKPSFSGAGGIGGSLANVLSALLPFLIKKPKLLIVVLVVGAILYLLFGRG